MSDGMSDYAWEERNKEKPSKKQKTIIKYNPIEIYETAKHLVQNEDNIQDMYYKIKKHIIEYHNTECYSGIGGFYVLYEHTLDYENEVLEVSAQVVVNLAMGSYITEEIVV